MVKAVAPQSLELPDPIHDPSAYRSPIVFVIRLTYHILAVAVPNPIFG